MINVGCQKIKDVDLNVGPHCRCDEVEDLYGTRTSVELL